MRHLQMMWCRAGVRKDTCSSCLVDLDWISRKQKTVTSSTTEAELLSLQHAAKELQVWHYLFNEIEFDMEQADKILECYNRQTVRLTVANNPIVKTNIRYINISDLWLRQEHHAGRINVTWVETDRMEADGLIKPLPKAKFDQFVYYLGMQGIRALITN